MVNFTLDGDSGKDKSNNERNFDTECWKKILRSQRKKFRSNLKLIL